MGGGSNNLGITKSGLKLGQANNINHMKNSVAKTNNETVNQLLEQILSTLPMHHNVKYLIKKYQIIEIIMIIIIIVTKEWELNNAKEKSQSHY